MTIHCYIRCSTSRQEEESQRQQVREYLGGKNISDAVYTSDTASGSTPWQNRALQDVLMRAQRGDWIVVSEISRIARSTIGVLSFLESATLRGINVAACKNKIVLDGSLPAKITITILALAAEIERDLLRERTRAALEARRARGLPLGRPLGSRSASILDARRAEIQKLIDAKVSKRAIARVLDVSPQTLYSFLARASETEAAEQAGKMQTAEKGVSS